MIVANTHLIQAIHQAVNSLLFKFAKIYRRIVCRKCCTRCLVSSHL